MSALGDKAGVEHGAALDDALSLAVSSNQAGDPTTLTSPSAAWTSPNGSGLKFRSASKAVSLGQTKFLSLKISRPTKFFRLIAWRGSKATSTPIADTDVWPATS
jgi:hypothetical protein